jgi:hypothetical protein
MGRMVRTISAVWMAARDLLQPSPSTAKCSAFGSRYQSWHDQRVLQFRDIESGELRHTAWFRRLQGSGNVLYAGFYSITHLPECPDPMVKVVFPLPNGNAIVLMRTECRPDHSFVVTSAGEKFGDAGFYFTVDAGNGSIWTRHVRSLQESIHVFPSEAGVVRANHILHLWGFTFLKLHYRMRKLLPNNLVQQSIIETSACR